MRTLLLILWVLTGMTMSGQSTSHFVDSLRILPVTPNNNDSITFIAYTRHATTGSGRYDRKIFLIDTVVNIYSCWTNGPLQESEYVNDTFQLSPMPSGDYTIRFIYKTLRPWELDSIEPCLTNPYYDSTFLAFTVYAPNSVSNLYDEKPIDLYPNPATNQLTIQANNLTTGSYQIATTTGQLLLHSTITQPNFTIDVSTLPSGLYFLQLTNGKQRVTRKFIKE